MDKYEPGEEYPKYRASGRDRIESAHYIAGLVRSRRCNFITTGVTMPRIKLTGRNRTAVNSTIRSMIGRDWNPSATVAINGKIMTEKIPAPNNMRPNVVREGKRSAVSRHAQPT